MKPFLSGHVARNADMTHRSVHCVHSAAVSGAGAGIAVMSPETARSVRLLHPTWLRAAGEARPQNAVIGGMAI